MTERPPRFGEHRALEQLGLALEGLGDGFSRKRKDLEKSAALARQGWAAAAAVIDIVAAVEAALTTSLTAGRARLRRLCSRDPAALSAIEIRESALGSLAENLNDSVVAPLFWFVLGGLPGAALYRFANTADAMWGYRGRWEWAGKWSARADDVLSYVPARLTALLIAIAGFAGPHGLVQEAGKTPSPNGGWPMAMMALALDVRLTKRGVYVLHGAGRRVAAGDCRRGLMLATRAAWLAMVAAVVAIRVLACVADA